VAKKIKISNKKFCSKCKFLIHINDFYKKSGSKDGLTAACKNCVNKANKVSYHKHKDKRFEWGKNYRVKHKTKLSKYMKEYNQKYPNRQKNYDLIRYYGINLECYNKMFEEQSGCCAICGRHQSTITQSLGVDHNHKTGQIRELLCRNCNVALGCVNDDIEWLGSLIEYVKKHKAL